MSSVGREDEEEREKKRRLQLNYSGDNRSDLLENLHIMEADEFRQRGREMVDFIADYLTTIRTRRVFPNVKPGYMRPMMADEAPRQGEPWEQIFNDIERVIMPGVGLPTDSLLVSRIFFL